MKRYHDLLTLATTASARASEHIRNHPRPADPLTWHRKGVSDFVTDVDRSTEALIADTLLAGEPHSQVMGEECTPEVRAAPLLWVVDPLDGTTNYLHGFPAYAVSIACLIDGELAVGVVTDVERRLTYHAVERAGAHCGDRRLTVSSVTDPTHALIGTGFPFKAPELLPEYLRAFSAILAGSAGIRRAGAASLDFVDIALGRFDGFWEPVLAPWDVAAGALIVREAGGVVTGMEGERDVLRHGAFVAGNPAIHAWLLATLENVGRTGG